MNLLYDEKADASTETNEITHFKGHNNKSKQIKEERN